jgi:holliday junction DNA helicase RuvA
MYVHLRGTLESKNPAAVVIDVGGVGYGVSIPLSTFERLPAPGNPVKLFTSLAVREDAMRLFGFASAEERTFFLSLLAVTGVGPAVALGIVSSLPLAAFQAAVLSGDAARLRRVKGVGKRLSERLVLELNDVMRGLSPTDDGEEPDTAVKDALLALEALGFARLAAEKAVKKARETGTGRGDPGDLVRAALQML